MCAPNHQCNILNKILAQIKLKDKITLFRVIAWTKIPNTALQSIIYSIFNFERWLSSYGLHNVGSNDLTRLQKVFPFFITWVVFAVICVPRILVLLQEISLKCIIKQSHFKAARI